MTTYFLPAARANSQVLRQQIKSISTDRTVDNIMLAVTGLVAVLNQQRQIVGVNQSFLEALGGPGTSALLGLRLGEVIRCVHAHRHPGGCGTSDFCRTCGAAIVIATCQAKNKPAESYCALQVNQNGKRVDLFFQVRCSPLNLGGKRFYLITFQDGAQHQNHAALARVVFHDFDSLISGLLAGDGPKQPARALKLKSWKDDAFRVSLRLASQLSAQKHLANEGTYQPRNERFTLRELVVQLQKSFQPHPAAKGKSIRWPRKPAALWLKSDLALVIRVISNMLINALEATHAGGHVKVSIVSQKQAATISVWNQGTISADVSKRIFQRNFSTKPEPGRGLGTYAMKVFGEQLLQGEVGFTTSRTEGTTFRFTLPLGPR